MFRYFIPMTGKLPVTCCFGWYGRGMSNDGPAPLEDDIDLGIVRVVSHDARATLADLSAAVGLSVSAVQTRLRRLESRGVITGYRALVDAEAAGKPLAAFVEITPLDPAQPDN